MGQRPRKLPGSCPANLSTALRKSQRAEPRLTLSLVSFRVAEQHNLSRQRHCSKYSWGFMISGVKFFILKHSMSLLYHGFYTDTLLQFPKVLQCSLTRTSQYSMIDTQSSILFYYSSCKYTTFERIFQTFYFSLLFMSFLNASDDRIDRLITLSSATGWCYFLPSACSQ